MMASAPDELEAALVAGASDEAARPRFYETLLRSTVLIVPAGEVPAVVDGVVKASTRLSLATVDIEGVRHVPFFSSERHVPAGTEIIGLSATDFLRMASGAHLVLNPYSDHGKAFTPDEVASLLDGSMFRPSETVTARGGEQQLIGQPKQYPHAFAELLARFLASEPGVEKAFIAQHFIAGMHTEPALLVAIVAPETGFERLAGAIGLIARQSHPGGAVDVTRLDGRRLGYFGDQMPIYQGRKRGLFARLFG